MRRLLALALACMAVTAGCASVPRPPGVTDGPLVVLSRAPVAVPPDATGGWPFLIPSAGLLGAGRTLARYRADGTLRWIVTLPAEYALTASNGPHSAFTGGSGRTIVVVAGDDQPSAVTVLDIDSGKALWQLDLPAAPRGGTVTLSTGDVSFDEVLLVISRCGDGACDLDARAEVDGSQRWTAHLPGAAWVAGGFEPVTGGRGPGRSGTRTNVLFGWMWAGGPTSMWMVSTTDGTVQNRFAAPAGPIGHVIGTYYRTVFVTVPDQNCRATATAYAMETTPVAEAWSIEVRWDDPRVAPNANGCRYDPAQRIMWSYDLMFPSAGGTRSIDDYHGTAGVSLPAGAYQVADPFLVWTGTQYRTLADDHRIDVPPPADGRVWAVPVTAADWVLSSGDGASLANASEVLWHEPGALTALTLSRDRLAIITATEIVLLGPKRRS